MGKLYNHASIMEMIGNDKIELVELMKMFVDLCPVMILEIEESIDSGNFKIAGDVAHKLKTTVRMWEMEEIIDDIIFIEQNGKNGTKTDRLKPVFMEVKEKLNNVLSMMKKEIEETLV